MPSDLGYENWQKVPGLPSGWKPHDSTINSFDALPACDGRTNRQADRQISYTCRALASERHKKTFPSHCTTSGLDNQQNKCNAAREGFFVVTSTESVDRSVSTASCLYDVFAYNQLQTDICIHVRSFRHTHSCMVTDYGRVQQLTGRISRTAYVIDRSAVGQLSSLSTRTKWQRLPAGDTLRCHFVLLDRTKVVQQLTCLT